MLVRRGECSNLFYSADFNSPGKLKTSLDVTDVNLRTNWLAIQNQTGKCQSRLSTRWLTVSQQKDLTVIFSIIHLFDSDTMVHE